MVIELRTLRVTSDFDAGRYVAGMNQKVNADKAGAQSSKAAGAAVEEQKIKVSSSIPLLERLSRTYVDGYGTAAKFNTEILRLARSQDTNAASAEHLERVYDGLQRKFGLIADATELRARGFVGVANAIDAVNQRLSHAGGAEQATALSARVEQLRRQFDPTYVSAQRLTDEVNDLSEAERLGVQITGGYERALEAIVLKHDAVAAAAKRQREEYSRLAQEAREAAAADRAQQAFNQRLGVFNGPGIRASDSAAVFAEQLARQEEINRLRAQQQADNFAADLGRRFFSGSGSSAQSSAAVFSAEFARLEELQRQRAMQQGSAFTSDLNQRLGVNGFGTSARGSAAAFEEAARAAEELDRKAAALRAQIDPLGAAQRRLNAELAEYDELARRNAISAGELVQAQSLARQRYAQTAKEIEKQGASGLQRARMLEPWQVNNLLYQGYDVAQSLALGMPAMQVFLQQGPQIAQIFSAGNGAMRAMLGVLTPLNLALGGTAAIALLGAKAWYDYLKATKEVETAAAGLGRATAGSLAEMEASARAGASAAGISVASARSMEVQFLRTGRIGAEHFETLIALSKDFGATIGVDANEAGKKLSEMFADPANASKVLYQQYGLINAATARQAANLAAQNRESEAQALLLRALPSQLADAEQAATALGRAWNSISNAASDAYEWMGRAVDRAASGPTIDEQLADAQARLDRFSGQSWLLRTFNGGQEQADDARREIENLQENRRRQNQAEFERQRAARDIARGRRAESYANSSGANADAIRIETLQNEIAGLRSGQSVTGIDQGRVTAAIEAKTRALDALINRQARALELDRLDVQIQNEINPLRRADLEARRARLEMGDQEINSARIEEEAARARARIISETIGASEAQNRDMQAEVATRIRLAGLVAAGSITAADANRILQEELSLRGLVEAATMAEGEEKRRLQSTVDDLMTSYEQLAQQRKEEAAAAIVRGQNDQIETLRAEIALVGESEKVRRRTLALLEAEQQIRRDGLAGTADAQKIRDNAAALSDMTAELERQRDAWGELRSAGESAIDTVFDGLSNGKFDFKSIAKDLGQGLLKSYVELDIKNPLKNRLLGTNYGTLSDLTGGKSGGILSTIFGGAGSVGAMSVNAATVNINGGVLGNLGGSGGVLGSLTGAANDNGVSVLGGKSALGLYAQAVKDIESSGGNYRALGPITASGDRAYGAYQIMGANIGPWTKSALGHSMTPQEFLRSDSAQDAVFDKVFGSYVSKYGADGAAQAWFGGPGSVGKGGAGSDLYGTTGTSYVAKFNASLDRLSNAAGSTTGSIGTLGSGLDAAGKGLGDLGSGMGQFGKNLSGYFPAAPSGGGGGIGGFFSRLFGGGGSSGGLSSFGQSLLQTSPQFAAAWANGGVGLYDGGGYTGAGGKYDVRGLVHAGEVVWSQADIARAGGVQVVEAMRLGMRGYADGGPVGVVPVSRPILRAANSNPGGYNMPVPTAANLNVRMLVEGAQTPEDMRRAGYEGMQRALEEYDANRLPARIRQIQNYPEWG
ncbi:UNVERIFIED_ORG: phage tail length tape measure family protein [Roseateles sp. XES5]|nr:phage tail length tape measure family protein [Roseateles sp. XES5]